MELIPVCFNRDGTGSNVWLCVEACYDGNVIGTEFGDYLLTNSFGNTGLCPRCQEYGLFGRDSVWVHLVIGFGYHDFLLFLLAVCSGGCWRICGIWVAFCSSFWCVHIVSSLCIEVCLSACVGFLRSLCS